MQHYMEGIPMTALSGRENHQDNQVSIAHRNVTPEYISTSGMQIIEGRDFSKNTSTENSNVIINESMAKIMGKERAVGKIIQSPRGNPEGVLKIMTVIGVVKDYVYGNVYDGKVSPLIIFNKPPEYQNFIYVRIKPQSNVEKALAKIAEVMKKDNPAYPLEYKFVDDQFNQMFQNETLTSNVSTVFAALAIIISCLGLIWLSHLYCRTKNKRNRHPKSIRCKCFRHYSIIVKRFFTVGCYFLPGCLSCRMVDNA